MEFWLSAVAAPQIAADMGRGAEAAGYDGLLVVDSQNLSGDPYVFLALAAGSTETLGLETSVTNPVTRHAATTASSALSVDRLSGGRMILGIGRGDSALAHLGHAPARLSWFERYLQNLRTYLAGEAVAFEDTQIDPAVAPPIDALGLADTPEASRIHWAGRDARRVPIEVAATGPRVIAIAARHADRVLFALGADEERLAWAIDAARTAAQDAGRDPGELRFGAYVPVATSDDLERARKFAMPTSGLFARFSAMYGHVETPADADSESVFREVHARYDMNQHAQPGGRQTTALTPAFLDRFAIVGPPDVCIERIRRLEALGLDKLMISGPSFAMPSAEARAAGEAFTKGVMPAFR